MVEAVGRAEITQGLESRDKECGLQVKEQNANALVPQKSKLPWKETERGAVYRLW